MSLFLLLATIGMVTWGWWRIGLRKREMDREHDDRESLRRRIEQDPNNLAAYEALGDNLLRARRHTQAVAAYRDALALINDESADFKAGYQLKYKIKQIEDTPARQSRITAWLTAHQKQNEVVFCGACGESNGPWSERCRTCGALLLTHGLRRAIVLSFNDKPTRQSLIETAAIIAVMIGVLRFVSFLPDDIKALLVISTALVLSGRLIWSFVQVE